MRASTIVAVAFLFVFVGVQRVAQADEVKAKMEEIKGETNAKIEEAKGEAKALTEEAKGNKMQCRDGTGEGENKSSWREDERHRETTEGQDRVNHSRIYPLRPCGDAISTGSFLRCGQHESAVIFHCHRSASYDSRELAP